MTESTVVSLPLHGGVEDPLTEVLRAGARELVRHAVKRRWRRSWRPTTTNELRGVVGVWCVTGMARSGRS